MAPPNDFYWSTAEEPHVARRKAIMAKYGKEVNKLMGPEPRTKFIATAVVVSHILFGLFVAPSLSWPMFFLVAYALGGTATHNLFLAIHEVTHNLAFKKSWANDAFAMFLNLPMAVPYSMMFKTYHAEHHRYQGWDGVDADIAADMEARVLNNFFGKLFFLTFQILFYAFRPCIVRPMALQTLHKINYAIQIAFDLAVMYFIGFTPIAYFGASTVLACSLHPMAGHFIAEHYIFEGGGKQETFSYYGPLNILGWNVGYHNEHHDFPNVPWSRLRALREMAPEFYDNLIQVDSWPMTLVRFLFDSNINEYCRVKRERNAGSRKELISTATSVSTPSSPTTKP